jgi:hypothetical protein
MKSFIAVMFVAWAAIGVANAQDGQKSVAEMQKELAALPDPLSPDFPHQMCVYIKAPDMGACMVRMKKIQEETAEGIPMYDSSAYCGHIGDVAGGSSQIELTCRQQEAEAHEWIRENVGPERSMRYCGKIGSSAGGSYQIFKACLQQEISAAVELSY